MIIYVDGGFQKQSQKVGIISWGILIHNDSTSVEILGAKEVKNNLFSYHEEAAFVEAYLYAKSHGMKNEEVTYYVDCEVFAYAGFWLHKENYSNLGRVTPRLKHYCQDVYPSMPTLVDELVECLLNSRFVKEKAHTICIDNLRVDALAKFAREQYLGKKTKLLPFDEWLKAGFKKYIDNDNVKTWYPPFVRII